MVGFNDYSGYQNKKKQRILGDTLLYNQIKIKLYLDLNLNTAGELELHQSVNSLSS
jgi:hypothetical protein